MNTTKQFWTLLKFHFAVSPYVWALPVVFCVPLFFMAMGEPALNTLLVTQNFFLVVLFGGVLLAPEILNPSPSAPAAGVASEFLLTRAVDKVVVARSKSAFFYTIILSAPVVMILLSLRNPDLQTRIYDKAARAACLASLPGSRPVFSKNPDFISIVSGNVILALWRAWIFVILAVAVQALIYAVYPFRLRRAIITAFMFAVAFAPALSIFPHSESVAWDLRTFFFYAGHQVEFWIVAFGLVIIGQIWSERRFTALEQ